MGKFIRSPVYKAIMIAVVSFVPVVALASISIVHHEIGIQSPKFIFFHTLFAVWEITQFIFNFISTQFTDPGNSFQVKPDREATGQFEMYLERYGQVLDADDVVLFAPNYCERCQHWKPPRSHHCRICERCTLRMDHHCPFTGNCIGLRNHGHFFLMFVFAIVGLTHSMIMCLWASSVLLEYDKIFDVKSARFPGMTGVLISIIYQFVKCLGLNISVLMFSTIIAFIAVIYTGHAVILNAISGQTLLEILFPMKEHVEIRPEVYLPLGPGFYSQNCFSNLQVILGDHWCLRLLIPFRQRVFIITPAVHPVPGVLGVCALRQVVDHVDQNGHVCRVLSYDKLGINLGPGRRAPTKEV